MPDSATIPNQTAAALLNLMQQADGGQPFMTHKAAAALGAYILAELGKIASRATGAGEEQETPCGTTTPRVLLTKKELAKALHCGVTTIDNMRKLPGFPEHHLTGTTRGLRFNLDAVRSWQEKQRKVKEAMAL